MKGLSIQSGIELRVEVAGESWTQGSAVPVKLVSKNASPVSLALAIGIEKKIRSKAPDAFEILQSVPSALSPLSHTFELPLNARITDKTGSLHILYGLPGNTQLSQLRLQINPHPHLTDLISILNTEFRFSLKSSSMSKHQAVEFRLEPPYSKEWASLEEMILTCALSDTSLETQFKFHRKEIDASQVTLKTISTQRIIKRTLAMVDCLHSFNQRLNPEVAVETVDSVFNEYKSQSWLPA